MYGFLSTAPYVMLKCITYEASYRSRPPLLLKEVEAQLAEGEEIEIVKRKKVIAKLVPVPAQPVQKPDFMARMKAIHGDVILEPPNAELLAEERERF